MRLNIVRVLLQAGAKANAVDTMLDESVHSRQKSVGLIEALVIHGARITEEVLFTPIMEGALDVVKILTSSELRPQILFAAIPYAMKLQDLGTRYDIMELLLTPIGLSGIESSSVTQAVIDILEKRPADIDLLHLICQLRKPNINLFDGNAVKLAIPITILSF
jgi:hypothetical protein